MDSQTQNLNDIARLIARRYGDGGVYLAPGEGARRTLQSAQQRGFVSFDGFITRKGRALLATTEFTNLRG